MLKVIKSFFPFVISIILIFQSMPIASFASSLVSKENEIVATSTITEEKVYCEATLEDDFENDCVIVVIDHERSIINKEFTIADFPGVDAKEIVYLSVPINTLLRESENDVETQKKAEILNLVNIEDFHHILCIELNTVGKNKVLEAIKVLEEFDFVLSAGPDYIIEIEDVEEVEAPPLESASQELPQLAVMSTYSTATNDTFFSEQYALEKIQAIDAWSITKGSSNIRVGVVDSGIYEHSDLIANLSDGWDFYNDNGFTGEDSSGHGTRVAGVIGAVGNNGIGVCGINWNVTIVPLKYSHNGYTRLSIIANAIKYAQTNNIPILNCSFGDYDLNSNDLELAFMNYNGLVVCSAGNEVTNTDEKLRYPSCYDYDNIISVAASNKANDGLYKTSNYGATTVDLAAPGELVRTTTKDNGYGYIQQTSCAAPHVTGVAALILSVRSDLSAEQVKACILNGVDKVDALQGKCVTGGRLNAYKALQLALDFPKDQMVSGDFDGNGKDDVAYITDSGYGSMKIYVRENGVGTPTLWTEETAFYTANVGDRVTAGDFNGDGKDDIALLYDNKNGKARIHVLLSNGDGFNSRSSWFVQSVEGMYNANRTTGRVTSGDFNGDGLDDVSAMYDNGDGKMRIHMFISTGNSFNWEYWYEDMAGGNFYASGVTGRYEAGDFNGDGKDDIAAMYGYADGRTRVHVWLSNGTSLNQRTAWFIQDTPYYYNTERVKNRFVTGDFNDDGKDDICTLYEYSSGTMMLHVFVSQGNTFSWWQNWYHSSATGSFYTNAVTGFNSGDYNGDGKMDIMLRYSYQAGYSKLLQYQSNGSSFNYIAKFLY